MDPNPASDLPSLMTLYGEITFDKAVLEESNMLPRLTYCKKRSDFYRYLFDHRPEIEKTVSCYLRLKKSETCRVSHSRTWMEGSFNVCLPVYIENWSKHPRHRVIIRFPLPYKTGESNRPGNNDEKLRCEAAAYAWIQENCPDVPIPHLWGFALSEGQSFINLANAPVYTRLKEYTRRRMRSLLRKPVPSPYIRHRSPFAFQTGYLVIDYVEETDGTLLSESWEALREDKRRRINLFKSLSRIILSLGRIPLPRIGSFTIDDAGVISLTNRPLTLRLQYLENEGIPTMDRERTYTSVEPYQSDLLTYHDNRLRYQPNSSNNEVDCRAQMAALTSIRSILPHFINRDLQRGPFLFTLTDLSPKNIFVDGDGYVRRLIDLEWACTQPMQSQHPPYWITNRSVDELEGDHLAAFDVVRKEFMSAFEAEERLLPSTNKRNELLRSRTMRNGWEKGNFFLFHALETPTGLFNIFRQHIQPLYAPSHVTSTTPDQFISPYWTVKAEEFVCDKMKERNDYIEQLRAMFLSKIGKTSKEDIAAFL